MLSESNGQNLSKPSRQSNSTQLESHLTNLSSWPPSCLEIDSLLSGQPISVQVQLSNGELVQRQVDEQTTVEGLLDSIKGSHPFFQRELETETFWLFRQNSLG